MADERVVSEIVTEFFLNTCRRLRPQLSDHIIQAVALCAELATSHPEGNPEVDAISSTTGSVAEFYIEPMLPHIGDVDVMLHRSTQLAIPRGHPPPTQLPDEFSNCVEVFEIVDSVLPGYVYLKSCLLLRECIEDDKCNYRVHIEFYNGLYLSTRVGALGQRNPDHGPALLTDMIRASTISVDLVNCLRCLSWPPQAADWPSRHRNYGWPDSATVDRVVSNGCDVVPVVHRQCRQDEWMSKRQWRLSFSRAEIILINSWMEAQQIVYHMLRVFVKTELLANSEACALSNYHIKSLMLWAGELKSSSFWTVDLNLIGVCVELLHTLSAWLTDARCPHYFINDCNLIDNAFDVEIIAYVESIDETWLSNWFVYSYIRKCSMLCPDSVSGLFSDVNTNMKLQHAVSAVVNWRLNTALEDACEVFCLAQRIIPHDITNLSLTLRSTVCWISELAQTNTCLPVYFTAVAFLHVAYEISMFGFTDELMDILATIAGQFISTRRHPSQCSSELPLRKATELMKVVANCSHSTMQLIEIELSKAYLYTALRCKDSTWCLANVYLAVLYYTSGQYQTAIDLCTLVTRSQDHPQCSSHVVQGELLIKIDDAIDNALGLAVFYQYVRSATLNEQQKQHVSVFTTELFAHYLNIRCLPVTQMRSNDEARHFRNYLCDAQLLIADVLAAKSVICKCHCQPTAVRSSQQSTFSLAELNTSELVELLQRSAVEHLTTFRQLEAQVFGPVATIVTTDFQALYAYKHGDYQRCLQLSTQNVRTTLNAPDTSDIQTFPLFIPLLDDDIVSLIATILLIIDPKYRYDNYYDIVSELTLSLHLMTQCQMKLRHSVTSLAQTFGYIKVALRRHPAVRTLDHLTLKLTKRKLLMYLSTFSLDDVLHSTGRLFI